MGLFDELRARARAQQGGLSQGGAIGLLSNPNFGLTQFMRTARAAAATSAEFSALNAQRGLSRDSGSALAGLQSADARLKAGTQALTQLGKFRLGAISSAAQIQFGQEQAAADRLTSFANNILGIGAGLLGQHLGNRSAGGGLTPTFGVGGSLPNNQNDPLRLPGHIPPNL